MPSLQSETKYNCPKYRVYDISKAKVRGTGDISSVFTSFENSGKVGLPQEYAEVKKNLIKNKEALTASWYRLKTALADGIKEIKEAGPEIIPQVLYNELGNLTEEQTQEIRRRGSLIIKNVIPKEEAIQLKKDVIDYIDANPNTTGFPKDKKVVYELYWSKSQVRARSHPHVNTVMSYMNNLWHASPDSEICFDQNISYADRLRIRNAGDGLFSLGPHADGGSLERWEDEEYSNCYTPIFEGNWENFDPYDATHRIEANMDLHESRGTCSMFRTFQGWLAVSDIAPKEGTILFAPLVKEVTAYYMLKPFFDENDELKLDSDIPGASPGKGLEFNNKTHPEMDLDNLMVLVPRVEPGDMVFWHCDLVHAVDPVHIGKHDSSVFYIPSVPLCGINVEYAFLQREAFLKGLAGPDFPGFPHGVAETQHINRGTPKDVIETGGKPAMQEFVLDKFEEKSEYT
ncbi:uncharacterized protein AC631_05576, partial [Debaryomyces fabryi]